MAFIISAYGDTRYSSPFKLADTGDLGPNSPWEFATCSASYLQICCSFPRVLSLWAGSCWIPGGRMVTNGRDSSSQSGSSTVQQCILVRPRRAVGWHSAQVHARGHDSDLAAQARDSLRLLGAVKCPRWANVVTTRGHEPVSKRALGCGRMHGWARVLKGSSLLAEAWTAQCSLGVELP